MYLLGRLFHKDVCLNGVSKIQSVCLQIEIIIKLHFNCPQAIWLSWRQFHVTGCTEAVAMMTFGSKYREAFLPWWRHQMETFSAILALCEGNLLIKANDTELRCFIWSAWTNGWAINLDAGNLRRHRAHSDVTVMTFCCHVIYSWRRNL